VLRSCLASGTPVDVEARMRRFDGAYRWFLFRANPLRDASGKIVKWYGTTIDIADRKRAEEVLRASELSGRQIVDSIPGLVATMSAKGEVEFLNRQILEYFGKTNDESKSWALVDAVHPDDLPRVIEVRAKSIEAGHIYNVEHRCRRADGVYRWFQVRGLPVRDANGAVTRWYLLLTDIEERKQAEAMLRRSEAYLTEAQRLSRSGSWTSNLRSGELLWSQEMLMFRILGYDPEKAKPDWSHFLERVHPKHRPLIEHRAATESTESNWADPGADYRLLLPDGTIKHLHSIAHTVFEGSEPVEVVGTSIDVTQSKEAEEQLRRSGAFLAEGQPLSRTGSFSWRVETGEITWSEELYRIFGFEPGMPVTLELIGSRVHPDDLSRMSNMLARAHRAASDFEFEHRIQLPNHPVKYIHVIGHGTRDKDGRLEYSGAAQDVTQRRVSEQALVKAQSELAQVARVTSLGVLTASIAHEVNQPLSGIITNASTCLRMLSADPPNVDGARETAALGQEVEMQRLRDHYASLTPREREVVVLVVSGLLNKQVGGELGISEITVKAHRGKVMQKMKADPFADLVKIAERLRLAPAPKS
jgi:PAS domain S-box-containing protein